MCGLCGAVGWIDPEVAQAVARMSAAMIHRGPDDHGSWTSGEFGNGAVFGFRRLSILDLSAEAHQPIIDEKRGNVLVFNGEIYNYRELRQELQREGESFSSSGDSEVLLKAYGRWGLSAIEKLRGMFAFAIWNASSKQIVLGRDRVGIKPLYIYPITSGPDKKVLLFASELRAILASELTTRRLNPVALSTYIWNGFVPGPETIIQGVQLLPAGSMAIVDAHTGTVETIRYWQLPGASATTNLVDELEHELVTSISQHMVSDVPLGVFLSGGIDSSAVTALATQVNGSQVKTFNISFDEAAFDESPHARAVAQALGTDHTEVRLTQDHFRDQLGDALAGIDQPTFDAINTYFVSRAVREAGITVALAGTGGDELFGGYRSFVDCPKASRVSRLASFVPQPALQGMAHGITRGKYGRYGETPPQTRWGKLADVLATRGRPVDVYQASYSLFTRDFMGQLLLNGQHPQTRSGLPLQLVQELDGLVDGRTNLHAISQLELSCFIGQRLLRDTDAASMATSLEVRVPLLDHKVIEAAARIDPKRRFHPLGKKRLLRDLALQRVSPNLFDRPKAGFVLPIEVWCRRELQRELDCAFADGQRCASVGLNHDAVNRLWRSFKAGAPGMYWSRVWCLFVLLNWCERHRVSL